MKNKYEGQLKDRRGESLTQYQPWALSQTANPQKDRELWVKKIISYLEEQGKENPAKKRLAEYLKNKDSCHIIGFIPYVEYIKHKPEGGMSIEGSYLHAFGNPALLVFDKKSKSLLIAGPEIDFQFEIGLRG